uniref:Uncharacterized protein n=1 Tax=Streptomyces phage Scarif TaxID=3158858 RepID=A0AAU7GZ05_9CAUD
MSSGDIFVVIFGAWLAIVAIAWCIDNGTDILAQRKAARKAQDKEQQQVHMHRISTLLDKARQHRNAEVSKRPTGAHRLARVR